MKKLLFLLTCGVLTCSALMSPSNNYKKIEKLKKESLNFTSNYSLEGCESYEINKTKFFEYFDFLPDEGKYHPSNCCGKIDGECWKYTIYYFYNTIGYVGDGLKTQYSVSHYEGMDSFKCSVSTSFEKTSDDDYSFGGTIKVKGTGVSYANELNKGNALNVEVTCSANIDVNAPTGVYDLYIIDKRADALVRAECQNSSKFKYFIMKKIPYGRGTEFSIGKPVPSCHKYKTFCS